MESLMKAGVISLMPCIIWIIMDTQQASRRLYLENKANHLHRVDEVHRLVVTRSPDDQIPREVVSQS